MIFSIAWKNVWRNKLRSLIVILSIALGLLGGLFYLGFSNGMIQHQISSSIKTQISNIQLHHPEYLINDEMKYSIDNPESVIKKIKTIDDVKSAAYRVKGSAMISSAITGTGVTINGIDPVQEKKVTNLNERIIEGDYFKTKLRDPIVIGQKLADKLRVKIKSKIVITIQDMSGNITYGAFRVVGIYKTENSVFDLANIFVLSDNLNSLIGFDKNKATEIAIALKDNDSTGVVASKIKGLFSSEIASNKMEIETWQEIQPALKMLNDMTIQFTLIFVIIILVALSFGIINTMLMAIMERVREIGMLMAIGMSKLRVFLMIMLETVFLSVTGGVLGVLLSWIAIEVTNKTGIDLSSVAEGLNAWGYSSFVRPTLGVSYYILIVALVFITAMIASIFPARKALKLKPAEAVRQDV
ncbi:MAG: ABC transporter permease [Ignavibacteriae bacterium]|nr:MAG: ABC transporter permease [Ignavibacteriota bacterium]